MWDLVMVVSQMSQLQCWPTQARYRLRKQLDSSSAFMKNLLCLLPLQVSFHYLLLCVCCVHVCVCTQTCSKACVMEACQVEE